MVFSLLNTGKLLRRQDDSGWPTLRMAGRGTQSKMPMKLPASLTARFYNWAPRVSLLLHYVKLFYFLQYKQQFLESPNVSLLAALIRQYCSPVDPTRKVSCSSDEQSRGIKFSSGKKKGSLLWRCALIQARNRAEKSLDVSYHFYPASSTEAPVNPNFRGEKKRHHRERIK